MADVIVRPVTAAANAMESVYVTDFTTGQAFTTLVFNTANLVVAVYVQGDAAPVVYTGGNLETIATIGTYVAPTAGKCRFKPIDATNSPGLYQIMLANSFYTQQDIFTIQVFGVANTVCEGVTVQVEPVATEAGVADAVRTELSVELAEISATNAIADKIDTMLVLNGAVYEFTDEALEAALLAFIALADTIETGISLKAALQINSAAMGGKSSGATAGASTVRYRNLLADSKNRITATTDSNGNRTSITLDLT